MACASWNDRRTTMQTNTRKGLHMYSHANIPNWYVQDPFHPAHATWRRLQCVSRTFSGDRSA